MRNLFRPPSEALIHDLETAVQAIAEATPLTGAHLRELPFAVRDLSRMLTQDRSQMARSYWINKRLLTAYCRYFLPWNLVRLAWLLPGLDLEINAKDAILDLGSGPLTLPLALWLARPELRDVPLTVVCTDVSPAPMAMGKEIFSRLAKGSPWTIETRRDPVEAVLRHVSFQPKLITAVNVINEFKQSREMPLEKRLAGISAKIARVLAPGGRFLAVEPGTRLGGKLMALVRRTAFAAHLVPQTPCPHWGVCPMTADRATGWCHFTHTPEAAPKALAALTAKAGLDKGSLSLSCMLLRKASEEEKAAAARHLPEFTDDCDDDFGQGGDGFEPNDAWDEEAEGWATAYAEALRETAGTGQVFVRVISDPIRIPGTPEAARYCCSARGLALAHGAARIPSGAAVAVRWPEKETRDPKTGALEITVAAPSSGDGRGRGSGKAEGESRAEAKPFAARAKDSSPKSAPRDNAPSATDRKRPRGGMVSPGMRSVPGKDGGKAGSPGSVSGRGTKSTAEKDKPGKKTRSGKAGQKKPS